MIMLRQSVPQEKVNLLADDLGIGHVPLKAHGLLLVLDHGVGDDKPDRFHQLLSPLS